MQLAVFAPRTYLLGFCLLALTACAGGGSPATKTYSYDLPPTPGGRLCTNQCVEAADYCRQDCTLDQRRCMGRLQAQALQDYDQYAREQYKAHAPIELRPHDSQRTAPCDAVKKSCAEECEGHYQMCYQGCGGTVNTTTSCQAFCF